MSEHEGGDGKVGTFLLGFLAGVLVCLAAGGVFFFMQAGQRGLVAIEAEAMRREREAARRDAEEATRRTREEIEKARKGLEALKKAGE